MSGDQAGQPDSFADSKDMESHEASDEVLSAPVECPLLVCLLPARNAEHDLPGYLDCVANFCDAVVALDDGSTDQTWELLNRHPLVKVLLRNPRREDYRGWDDAANRNSLLEAAAPLQPEWLISLDADERLDDRDANSLRGFLETDALPGCAYGFRHVPMRNDADHFLPKYQWVYRLFSASPGQQFPAQKLHFIPVPTSIPRHRWVKTTLRIQHFGGATAKRRMARFNKYLEADPQRTYQSDYAHLLASQPTEDLRRWQPRPASMPVLLASGTIDVPDVSPIADDPGNPALSAIVIAQNDERTIAATVASVVGQDVPEPFEVIVVASGSDRTAAIVRDQFPSVTLVELAAPALPGEARNAGLRVARGAFVSFPGSHVELVHGSLAARLKAHRRGYAMVTGVTINGTLTRAGWASYFLDHAEGLPGHTPAELNGPPAHCSYARLPLLEVGGFPEGVRTAEDTVVNRALVKRGYVALRDPAVQFVHRSRCTSTRKLLEHHFQRGRGWGRMLVAEYRERGHLLNRDVVRTRLIEAIPKRLDRIEHNIGFARNGVAAEYRRVRGLIALGAVASWLGMWAEVLRPAPGKLSVLLGRPVVNVLVVESASVFNISLMQIDHVSRQRTMRTMSSELRVPLGDQDAALASVLRGEGDGQTASTVRETRNVLRVSLHIDDLECIIDHRTGMVSDPSATESAKSQPSLWATLARVTDVAVASLGTVYRLRRRTIQSTMPLLETITVVNRLRDRA